MGKPIKKSTHTLMNDLDLVLLSIIELQYRETNFGISKDEVEELKNLQRKKHHLQIQLKPFQLKELR